MLLHLREEYHAESLEIADLFADPITQFDQWFQDVMRAGLNEPNAMTLATCSADGKPSARIVLLKDYNEDGFTFFTNYESRKGKELLENPCAALVFFWMELHRQVRIEGVVEKVPESVSELYFQSRPRGSQVGAWASPQSSVLSGRQALDTKVAETESRFSGLEKLPLPDFWGGYLVRPFYIEFWQGRPDRLHDRFRYTRQGEEGWKIERLAP